MQKNNNNNKIKKIIKLIEFPINTSIHIINNPILVEIKLLKAWHDVTIVGFH